MSHRCGCGPFTRIDFVLFTREDPMGFADANVFDPIPYVLGDEAALPAASML